MRINTLEARLEEVTASLRAREAEVAERDVKIARLERQRAEGATAGGGQQSQAASSKVAPLVLLMSAVALLGGAVAAFLVSREPLPVAPVPPMTFDPPPAAVPEAPVVDSIPAIPAVPPEEEAASNPPPERKANEFNRAEAARVLGEAATAAKSCGKTGQQSGTGRVRVTFAPNGRVTSVMTETGPGPVTPLGACIEAKFRAVKIPPFDGVPVSVSKSFVMPSP